MLSEWTRDKNFIKKTVHKIDSGIPDVRAGGQNRTKAVCGRRKTGDYTFLVTQGSLETTIPLPMVTLQTNMKGGKET